MKLQIKKSTESPSLENKLWQKQIPIVTTQKI